MNIVHVNTNDISSLIKLTTVVVNESVDAPIEEKTKIIESIHSNINEWAIKKNCVFLRYQDNNITIGFVLIKEYWNFSDLFVLPSKQRQGIGIKLAKKAMLICKEKANKSNIRVNSSLNAVGFYKKLGFVNIQIDDEIAKYLVPLEFRF